MHGQTTLKYPISSLIDHVIYTGYFCVFLLTIMKRNVFYGRMVEARHKQRKINSKEIQMLINLLTTLKSEVYINIYNLEFE